MKVITRKLLLGFIATLICTIAFAQNKVTVTVQDEMGPIPGANVLIKGTTIGSMTDTEGQCVVSPVTSESVLVVSYIGYKTSEVTVGNRAKVTINLALDSEELEETVVVGFGTQKKASLTSSITNIQAEDIVSTKQTDLVASLQGKVPGLQIRQTSGQAGFFDSDLSLRGYGEPLVIIDGVARTSNRKNGVWGGGNSQSSSAALASLNPEDIESISVLKDASAAIYGIGAQNGVILVTTKKGQVGKPSVSYSNILSFGVPTAMPDEVDIVTYMRAENEMRLNSKKEPRFSEELIQHYINGDEGYIDFNWYDATMKKFTFNQTHNLSLRGGNQQTQYYLSANFVDQDQLYKTNNGTYKRYGITGNFTTQITDHLKATYQSSFTMTNMTNPPGNTAQNIFYYSLLAERVYPATIYGEPSHYSDQPQAEHRNPLALLDTDLAGYAKDRIFENRNNLDVTYDAPFLKGLKIQGSAALDFTSMTKADLLKTFPLYDYTTGALVNKNPDIPSYSESWNNRTRIYGRFQANYNTTIAQDYHVGATFAAEATYNASRSLGAKREFDGFYTHDTISQGSVSSQTNSGSRNETASAGYVGRINGDYKGKYLAEVMARYDGNYLYAPGYRWGLFPSYSLGWRVSEERFFKSILPKVNNFKLRWSDGRTGQAQGSPYAWQLGYTSNGSYVFNDGNAVSAYYSHSAAETLVSWARVRMKDFGFDMEAYRGLIGLTVDWFWRETSGIAATATSTLPDFYGISLPQSNLNKRENVGIDAQITHHNKIGKLDYRVGLTATYSRNRMTYLKSEETAIYSSSNNYYTSHTEGRWSNARGASTYHWLPGNPQFTSWGDIADSPVLYSLKGNTLNMLPGMYQIEDRNGDGLISGEDVYYTWSETNPPLQFGLTISGRYSQFDFNLNFSGATLVNKSISISGGMGYGFFNTFYENYMDHYKLADGYTDPFDPSAQWVAGYWPAIAKGTSAYDGDSNATYRYNQPYSFVNGTYVRLKSAEIGYTLSSKWLKALHLKSLRVYANGTNLLTFCNKLVKPYDPERASSSWLGVGGSPLIRTYSLGVNLNF